MSNCSVCGLFVTRYIVKDGADFCAPCASIDIVHRDGFKSNGKQIPTCNDNLRNIGLPNAPKHIVEKERRDMNLVEKNGGSVTIRPDFRAESLKAINRTRRYLGKTPLSSLQRKRR